MYVYIITKIKIMDICRLTQCQCKPTPCVDTAFLIDKLKFLPTCIYMYMYMYLSILIYFLLGVRDTPLYVNENSYTCTCTYM